MTSEPALWWNVYITGLPQGFRTLGGMGSTPHEALEGLREDLAAQAHALAKWQRLLDEVDRG